MTCFLVTQLLFAATLFEAELIFPPNAQHNHGSSIAETPQGDLIAAWFHGSGERQADDVVIQGARKRAGTQEWSKPFIMADTPDLPDCNPALFMDPRGVLWLFWITVQDNMWGGSLLKYRTSRNYEGDGPPVWEWQDVIHARPRDLEKRFLTLIDEGIQTYGGLLGKFLPTLEEEAGKLRELAQEKLGQRLGWMTRTPPIMVDATTLMLGLYSDVFNCSLAAFTRDWGATWSFSTPILDPDISMLGNIQPAFARRKDGEIAAFMRDNGLPKQVRYAFSSDEGITWSPVLITGIQNPGSSVDVEVLQSGNWVLVCNDDMTGRHRLAVYLSSDEGRTWNRSRVIEETAFDTGSFSYPAIIQAKDESLHVTYSYRKNEVEGSSIKHVRFNEAWILGQEAETQESEQ
jgi:predicted neuraminidase